MFSNRSRIIPFSLRSYSAKTSKSAVNLWVKHNGVAPVKVSTQNCSDIYDFAKKVKEELNTNNQITLFTSLEKEPIKPWLGIADLLKTDLKNNSGETPLYAKIIPTHPDSETKKTIFVGDVNEKRKIYG